MESYHKHGVRASVLNPPTCHDTIWERKENQLMGKTVILAEKPSVGRDIARVLKCSTRGEGCLMNDTYTVTWAVGHLVTLQEPDEIDEKYKKWRMESLPILPETIPLKIISSSRAQYSIVKKLINSPDTDRLICATDAGREGELIFRYIYEKAKCSKPFDRLWISSMTDEAIMEGFQNIRPGRDYDGLYESAKCRSEADWLVGMNASRAFTLKYQVLLSVGRVQTPTLAILVRRRMEIESFKPDAYSTLTADFGDYSGIWFQSDLDPDTHIASHEKAEEIARRIAGKEGTVREAETVRKRDLPPQLYDLTSLQRDANKLLGFTAQKTLKLAQSLYETHKALTYPRTDSRYLPPDMVPKVEQTLQRLPESYQIYVSRALPGGHIPQTKRTIDASKVTDHHAIIPTLRKVNPESFSEDERRLFDLVARRTIAAFYEPCVYDATRVITEVEGETFRTNGRIIIENGWRDVPVLEKPPRARKSKDDTVEEDIALPPLKTGDTRPVKETRIKDDQTKPPAQMTDASLLSAMENAGKESDDDEIVRQMKGSGIGTPATRAAIIERLIQVGYVIRKGKNLLATDKGVEMIRVMPEEITSPELTGRWELALDRITSHEQDSDHFMDSIRKFSSFLVDAARNATNPGNFPEDEKNSRRKGGKVRSEVIKDATCPLCGKGAVRSSPLAYSCSLYGKDCYFTLWKDCLQKGGGPEITEKLLRLILEKRQVKGSTGTILLSNNQISFIPNSQSAPSAVRNLEYKKKS